MARPVMGLILLLVCVLASRCGPVSGLFDWLKQTQPGAPVLVPGLPEGDAQPFEMTVADEKFLAEAKNMELSTLDSCHYRVMCWTVILYTTLVRSSRFDNNLCFNHYEYGL
jgi:hypothetical protein